MSVSWNNDNINNYSHHNNDINVVVRVVIMSGAGAMFTAGLDLVEQARESSGIICDILMTVINTQDDRVKYENLSLANLFNCLNTRHCI